jgi:hypothetical protein
MTVQLGLGLLDPGPSAIWTRDDGSILDPRTPEEWLDWVAAGLTRHWCDLDPLLDWLDRHGAERGFARDDQLATYDPAFDLQRFLAEQGRRFEDAVLRHLETRYPVSTIASRTADPRSRELAMETWRAIARGDPIVAQAVLRDPEARIYGKADLLMRSDVLAALWPASLDEEAAAEIAPALPGARWHYRVVDVKLTTLQLLKDGTLSPSDDLDVLVQLRAYTQMLGRLQGLTPPCGYVLGRGWTQGAARGTNGWERLGVAPTDAWSRAHEATLAEVLRAGAEWIRRLRSSGSGWQVLPEPTVDELWPNMKNRRDWPWHQAKREIAERLAELTTVWQITPRLRRRAHERGVRRWDDPRLTAAFLGIGHERAALTVDAILAANRDGGHEPVRPPRITADAEVWRRPAALELYVDFETVSDLADDFASFPERGGHSLIFQIGCGRYVGGVWRFEQFTARELTPAAEREILDAWIAHLRSLADESDIADLRDVRLFHWSAAETSHLETAYNSARTRHPDRDWPELGWYDLLERLVRAEPVVVRGAHGFGLKVVANALRRHGLIQTEWADGLADGAGAMAGAWHCAREAARSGAALAEVPAMREIERYNEIDCQVMGEVLAYLRAKH